VSLESMCRSTATLERHTITKDSSGGMVVPPWNTQKSDITCDIQPATASTILRWAQLVIRVSHTIYCTEDIGALAGDRITVTADDGSVRYFKVEGDGKVAAGYEDDWPATVDVIEEPQT
jgi:hypothetical protein